MKTLIAALLLIPALASAGGTKTTKISIDEPTTEIVEVDLGKFTYYIDTTACICAWRGGMVHAVFDCNRLKAYEKLKPFLKGCTP